MKEGLDGRNRKHDQPSLTRRAFLHGMLATGVAAALAKHIESKQLPQTVGEREQVREFTFLDAEPNVRVYDMGALAGMKLGEQFNRHFRLPLTERKTKEGRSERFAEVRREERIDFKYNLAKLWQEKFDRIRGDEPAEEYEAHHEGRLASIEAIYRGYEVPAGGSDRALERYRSDIERVVAEMESHTDFEPIVRRFKFGPSQQIAYMALAQSIDSDLLLSYAMTELMPSESGPTNARIFEFLLQNAGRGYIERIPALGDRLMSFGPYQFTRAALYHGLNEKGVVEINGASVIDQAQSHRVLPPNVESLRGDDHYAAAYYFALYNLAILIKDIGESGAAEAVPNLARHMQDARDYIVAAHHRPVDARKAFKRALVGRARKAHHGSQTFAQYCAPDVATYVRKSHANVAAVRTKIARAD